ncbi:MAG: 2-amino-4-hydroxy-6-hydroxymethyldihydropteridine diphosphokinase [Chloroflexi bacterium]|nr:2-amino-4-hydroxy-6-hydroxymethyldihydropteridine diphosphokinase [Chloroflexota bacterium]
MTKVYLSTGSNLGDRQSKLQVAINKLNDYAGISVLRVSPVYETEPWGYLNQPRFLNQVVEIETEIAPVELVSVMKHLEKEMGRTPNFKNGPRVIDMDIVLYGSRIIEQEGITIPHPFFPERAFVLVPLADLIPDFIHPVLGKTIQQLMAEIDCSGVTRYTESGEKE